MSELLTQTEARQLATRLSAETGLPHVAHTVPQGCWGGTEKGWAVSGPAMAELSARGALRAEQAAMRSQLLAQARAELRQAEQAQDWVAQVELLASIDRLTQLSP